MLRRMLVPIVGAIALLLLAGPASAAPRVPNGIPFSFLGITTLCPDFPVTLAGVAPAEASQLERTTLPDGTVILTGAVVVTVTNEENGNSATFNISGPTFRASDGAQILTGPALILLFDLGETFPDPGILATNGRGTIDAEQRFDADNFKGRFTDVCAQLI
jgi:hypothetical protein